MKRTALLAIVVVALLAPGSAGAATPSNARLAAQVKALTKRVTTLERQVRTLQRGFQAALAFSVVSYCGTALTADALQGTWGVIDQIAQPTVGRTFFGAQTPVQDPADACREIGVARSSAVPPTISPFSTLFALLA